MTFIWLIVWLCSHTPAVAHWNDWMIALVVCGAVDLLNACRSRD